ncbi:hypothetical protein BD847_1922 [Flavobacterium cutihirudinis]|uniref:Uncharacterized protein n=1 Tax=Flavobacterium cutihirudinis TaxID=1265740 RepID=A0A3D9FYH9_9FLAO|nr:hypothetical protein [Flavobacterium cutihirudinis]RED25177.1 hypothetical protein BD847_1922 [Flavobacterium cutihirudinis]
MLKRILNLEGAEKLTTSEQKSIFGEVPCDSTDTNAPVKAGEHYAVADGDRQCTNK